MGKRVNHNSPIKKKISSLGLLPIAVTKIKDIIPLCIKQ